jgi:hypothetical protein
VSDAGGKAEVFGGLGQVLRQVGGDLVRVRQPGRRFAAGAVADGSDVDLGCSATATTPRGPTGETSKTSTCGPLSAARTS